MEGTERVQFHSKFSRTERSKMFTDSITSVSVKGRCRWCSWREVLFRNFTYSAEYDNTVKRTYNTAHNNREVFRSRHLILT